MTAAPDPVPAVPSPTRLERYENVTAMPMVVAAFLFLLVYALPIIDPNRISGPILKVCTVLSAAIWIMFILDLVIRTFLAERRWHYLATHPIDVAAVVLPALRPLRFLRVFTAAQWIFQRGATFSIAKTFTAVGIAAAILTFVGAVVVLDAERADPVSKITSFGDALWYAFVTMSTVGYGDLAPVSVPGRIMAVALILVGISLLGVVTAALAAALMEKLRGVEQDIVDVDFRAEVTLLKAQHAEVMAELAALRELMRPPETVDAVVSSVVNGPVAPSP